MNSESTFTSEAGGNPVDHFFRVIRSMDAQEEDLVDAAEYLRSKTVAQTLSGFDVRNSPFAPYSPLYARKKGDPNVNLYGRRSERHMLDAVEGRITMDPPTVSVGIFNDPELAQRARVNNEGLTLSGRGARAFIRNLVHRAHQKVSGLKRQLKNKKFITVIPQREWLLVTPQDLRIMREMIGEAILRRMKGVE